MHSQESNTAPGQTQAMSLIDALREAASASNLTTLQRGLLGNAADVLAAGERPVPDGFELMELAGGNYGWRYAVAGAAKLLRAIDQNGGALETGGESYPNALNVHDSASRLDAVLASARRARLPTAAADGAQSAPVSAPAGKLAVWFGAMPESNGKTNWTAVLFRDEGGTWDFSHGFTIGRGEHKDRVRYMADCVRHLIGELPRKPDIREYDGQLTDDQTALQATAAGLPEEQEPKYTTNGRHLINRHSGEAIPHDEPVFIIRARDALAAGALGSYLASIKASGRLPDHAHADAVAARLADFERFASTHPARMKWPDTATGVSSPGGAVGVSDAAPTVESCLLADLREAAATLRRYEAYHRAKGTAESNEKAAVNAALAGRFEVTIALASARQAPTQFTHELAQDWPDDRWRVGNDFLPYHPSASHVPPDYRDGWNACYAIALSFLGGVVPADVMAAATRLATPLHDSRIEPELKATFKEDQHCADLIVLFLRSLECFGRQPSTFAKQVDGIIREALGVLRAPPAAFIGLGATAAEAPPLPYQDSKAVLQAFAEGQQFDLHCFGHVRRVTNIELAGRDQICVSDGGQPVMLAADGSHIGAGSIRMTFADPAPAGNPEKGD